MEKERLETLNEILEELTYNLDISETDDYVIRQSYKAVGEWLSAKESPLSDFEVEIRPQGSFNLGTIIRPINKDDDIDIDLVCELKGKKEEWTQKNVKQAVGKRLKENGTYSKMLDEEGRRCWTLLYGNHNKNDHYHMDILPCVINPNYGRIIEDMYKKDIITDNYNWDKAAIRITDKFRKDYSTSTDTSEWLKSNPFGYARWFFERAKKSKVLKRTLLNEGVKSLPSKNREIYPMQRVVQILKRHRDIYYGGEEDKPISIIITTLAAQAYNGEKDIYTALTNVVKNFKNVIREEYSEEYGRVIKVISNPVNPSENFADKWPEKPNKERVFYEWLGHLTEDLLSIGDKNSTQLMESFGKYFGKETSYKTFKNLSDYKRSNRDKGLLGITPAGTLTTSGKIKVKPVHNFYGKD